MKTNLLYRLLPTRLAQDSGDYPIPVADAAEILQELRADPPGPKGYSQARRLNLADDPSYCCEAHERLTDRLRAFGGSGAVGENVAAAFERRIRELDAQCPKAARPEVTP